MHEDRDAHHAGGDRQTQAAVAATATVAAGATAAGMAHKTVGKALVTAGKATAHTFAHGSHATHGLAHGAKSAAHYVGTAGVHPVTTAAGVKAAAIGSAVGTAMVTPVGIGIAATVGAYYLGKCIQKRFDKGVVPFLRMAPHAVLGNHENAVLYRWLKTALNHSPDYALGQLDFDTASFGDDRDVDAVFVERLRAYKANPDEENDPYWQEVVTLALNDRTALRFTETVDGDEHHYYVFPHCVFVSHQQFVGGASRPRKRSDSGHGNRRQRGGRPGSRSSRRRSRSHSTRRKEDVDLTDDERNAHNADRAKANARHRQLQMVTQFYGFSPKVHDGVPLESATTKRGKGGGYGPTNDRTYLHYLELRHVHKAVDSKTADGNHIERMDPEERENGYKGYTEMENGKELLLKSADGKGTDEVPTFARIAEQIQKDLKHLLDTGATAHIRVEMGEPSQRSSSHFNIVYREADRNAIAYDESKSLRKHYAEHEQGVKHTDSAAIVSKAVRVEDVAAYLSDRSDRCTRKQIVCRYYHAVRKDHRYMVYTVKVDTYGERTGAVVKAMLPPTMAAIDSMRLTVHSLTEYESEFELQPDADGTPGERPTALKLSPVEDDGDSSFETQKPHPDQSDGDHSDANTDPIRSKFKRYAHGSTLLQFLSHVYMSAVQLELGGSHGAVNSVSTIQKGRATLASMRMHGYLRFNTGFHFVHLMVCASHQYLAVTSSAGRMRTKGWTLWRRVQKGALLNLIGTTTEGANTTFDTSPFTPSAQPVDTVDYVSGILPKRLKITSVETNRAQLAREVATTPTDILGTMRSYYGAELKDLAKLLARGDKEEFFYLLRSREFWTLYARRIEQIHGYAYKEVVAPQYHETFVKELFYYQLRKAWGEKTKDGTAQVKIPTFLVTDDTHHEFAKVVQDVHRTIFSLKGLNTYLDEAGKLNYTRSLLESFGKHLTTTANLNTSTAADKTASEELVQETNQGALQERIAHLMREYKITDPMFIVDLQRKNTQLLFHFLHFVENNGALDTLGHLHVNFGHLDNLRQVIEHVVGVSRKTEDRSGDIGQTYTSLWQRLTDRRAYTGTNAIDKVAHRFFTMDPYLTIDPVLVRHMQKSDGFRYMLQDWAYNERLMFIRIHNQTLQTRANLNGRLLDKFDYSSMELYAFLPTYVYLTREARNLLRRTDAPGFVKHLRAAIRRKNGAAVTTAQVQTTAEKEAVARSTSNNFDGILQGLLYLMKQQLIETSGTNVFVLHLRNRAKTKHQLWLFGQWHRQYVLYDLKDCLNTSRNDGLKSVELNPKADHAERRIYNLLDDRLYESNEAMEKWVEQVRKAVTDQVEEGTTVHEEVERRASRKQRASSTLRRLGSRRNKLDVGGPLSTTSSPAADPYGTPTDTEADLTIGKGATARKDKMLHFVEMIQHFVSRGHTGEDHAPDGVAYPTSDIMWLLFRELYTFTPGMYNHVLAMVHQRLQRCESSAMLCTGGAVGDILSPKHQGFSLYERGLVYYVSNDPDRPAGSKYGTRQYFLQLLGPAEKKSSAESGFHRYANIATDAVGSALGYGHGDPTRAFATGGWDRAAPWAVDTTYNAAISTRLMLNMLVDHVGQLSQATAGVTTDLQTEWAEVRVMSWTAYLKREQVDKWTDPKRALPLSLCLNGLFASNAVLGKAAGMFPLASFFLHGSGVVASTVTSTAMSGVGSLALWLSKSVLSKAVGTMFSTTGLALGMGAVLGGSDLRGTVNDAVSAFQNKGSESNILSRLTGAFGVFANKAVGNVRQGSGMNDALSQLSAYLLCNTRILRVNTKFRLNGVFYKWTFDLGVDTKTQQVLMYHGIDNPSQVSHMSYHQAAKHHDDKDGKKMKALHGFTPGDVDDMRTHRAANQIAYENYQAKRTARASSRAQSKKTRRAYRRRQSRARGRHEDTRARRRSRGRQFRERVY